MTGGVVHIGLRAILVLAIVQCISGLAYAQLPAVDSGVAWLHTGQNADGDWGTNPDYALVDTSEVLETYNSLSINGPSYSDGISWISLQSAASVDYLSRIITALSGSGVDISADIELLVRMQNADGGFGGDNDAKSIIIDTALGLHALKAGNYPDLNIIGSAIGYLSLNQNPDGGWSFRPAREGETCESTVYVTALALKELAGWKEIFDLTTEIDSAVDYLMARQNTDGSFGDGTVYETALVYMALIESDAVGADNARVMQDALAYLENTQQANGSWNDNPYTTALALRSGKNYRGLPVGSG